MKNIFKKIYSLVSKIYVPLILPFISCKINIPQEISVQILNDYCPDSHGSIDADNKITPDYDLHIIIPCYNVEKYIVDCLQSVFSQKTKFSYFVTIINDGSTDSTLQLIENYIYSLPQEKTKYIQVINQNNKGFSGARNAGLKHILGKYIMFVDSDDKLTPNAIEDLLEYAFAYDSIIVEGGCNTINVNNKVIQTHIPIKEKHFGQPWAKVFKNICFKYLKFPDGYLFEDSIMACCLFSQYKVDNIKNIVYQYRINPNSITRTHKKLKKSIDVFYLYPYLWNWMKNNKLIDMPNQIKTILNQSALAYVRTVEREREREYKSMGLIY